MLGDHPQTSALLGRVGTEDTIPALNSTFIRLPVMGVKLSPVPLHMPVQELLGDLPCLLQSCQRAGRSHAPMVSNCSALVSASPSRCKGICRKRSPATCTNNSCWTQWSCSTHCLATCRIWSISCLDRIERLDRVNHLLSGSTASQAAWDGNRTGCRRCIPWRCCRSQSGGGGSQNRQWGQPLYPFYLLAGGRRAR